VICRLVRQFFGFAHVLIVAIPPTGERQRNRLVDSEF